MILRNDQLLWVTLAMVAYMAGYGATTSFGLYYFKYIFGDEGAYPIFAAILGVTQITALALFPLVSQAAPGTDPPACDGAVRARLPGVPRAGTSLPLVMAGVLLFTGQGAIQLLMVMFIADSVEYGEWKLGRRNESVTF